MDYVILAEDNPDMRALMSDFLSHAAGSPEIIEAADGQQAIDSLEERVKAGGRGVVVTDINMPGVDGWQVLSYVRTNHPGIPVIMAPMNHDPETEAAAKQLGAFAFLYKANRDFESTLLETVQRAFEQQK